MVAPVGVFRVDVVLLVAGMAIVLATVVIGAVAPVLATHRGGCWLVRWSPVGVSVALLCYAAFLWRDIQRVGPVGDCNALPHRGEAFSAVLAAVLAGAIMAVTLRTRPTRAAIVGVAIGSLAVIVLSAGYVMSANPVC